MGNHVIIMCIVKIKQFVFETNLQCIIVNGTTMDHCISEESGNKVYLFIYLFIYRISLEDIYYATCIYLGGGHRKRFRKISRFQKYFQENPTSISF